MGIITAFYVMPHPPIILPEIGKGEEQKISETRHACEQIALEVASIKPTTIVIISPHGHMFSNAVTLAYSQNIEGNFGNFGEPNLVQRYSINSTLTKNILQSATENNIACAVFNQQTASNYSLNYRLDHGAMVPLYFINKQYQSYKLVHITYGMLPKLELYKFGEVIQQEVANSTENVVFIASGDLSHKLADSGPYKFSNKGAIFDRAITKHLQAGDVQAIFNMSDCLITEAAECGMRSFYIMLGAMNGNSIKGNLLAYENTFGVGYAAFSFNLKANNSNEYLKLLKQHKQIQNSRINNESIYVKLARDSLKHYLNHGKHISIPSYVTPKMLNSQQGVFVSLKKQGVLRGCVGTFLPTTDNVATEIIKNAIQAGQYDPRFNEVNLAELPEITISVDILSKPQTTTINELDPLKYGVIVSCGHKQALLLPNLEGINTVEKQLNIVLQKARINKNEDYSIKKFKVIRHK